MDVVIVKKKFREIGSWWLTKRQFGLTTSCPKHVFTFFFFFLCSSKHLRRMEKVSRLKKRLKKLFQSAIK